MGTVIHESSQPMSHAYRVFQCF